MFGGGRTMHAYICDATDTAAIARLREYLRSPWVEFSERDSALGVEVYRVRTGSKGATIYWDAWQVDVEGSDRLVSRILAAVAADA
jgi:hypothetical protein